MRSLNQEDFRKNLLDFSVDIFLFYKQKMKMIVVVLKLIEKI